MYEYNFNEKRKTIEEELKSSLDENRNKYYIQLNLLKNSEHDYNLKDNKGVKKKKIIIKNFEGENINDKINPKLYINFNYKNTLKQR